MSSEEDVAALARVAQGDRQALGIVVRRHQAAVYRFARSLCPGPAAAQDVLQETFVAVLRHAGSFRGEGSVRGWLFRIARNQAASSRRKRSGEPTQMESLEILGSEAGWGAAAPDQTWERLATRDALNKGLSALGEEDREILLLRDVEGFSGPETASLLELSLAAMKSRLHRARLRLAAEMRKGGYDGAQS